MSNQSDQERIEHLTQALIQARDERDQALTRAEAAEYALRELDAAIRGVFGEVRSEQAKSEQRIARACCIAVIVSLAAFALWAVLR